MFPDLSDGARVFMKSGDHSESATFSPNSEVPLSIQARKTQMPQMMETRTSKGG
jgi:hypothetical protein